MTRVKSRFCRGGLAKESGRNPLSPRAIASAARRFFFNIFILFISFEFSKRILVYQKIWPLNLIFNFNMSPRFFVSRNLKHKCKFPAKLRAK